jgi:hypothetical protein
MDESRQARRSLAFALVARRARRSCARAPVASMGDQLLIDNDVNRLRNPSDNPGTAASSAANQSTSPEGTLRFSKGFLMHPDERSKGWTRIALKGRPAK